MLMSTVNQGYAFLIMLYAGIAIGLLYDSFRLLRRLSRAKSFITGVLDAAFWLTACAVAIVALYYACEGEVRLYAIAGLGLGALLYALGLGLLVRFLMDKLVLAWYAFLDTPPVAALLRRIKR